MYLCERDNWTRFALHSTGRIKTVHVLNLFTPLFVTYMSFALPSINPNQSAAMMLTHAWESWTEDADTILHQEMQ
jgi:hypothetical protein